MKLMWKDKNITGYTTSVTWTGSAKQAARSVVFNVAYSPNDKEVKVLNIKLGDKIVFYPGYPDDTKTKFVGMVTGRDRKSEAGEFTKYYGISPMNYLNRKRIEVCKELLENTDYGISDIAHLTGFSSQSYLSQSFRKSCGMTAGTYRKLKKKRKDPI